MTLLSGDQPHPPSQPRTTEFEQMIEQVFRDALNPNQVMVMQKLGNEFGIDTSLPTNQPRVIRVGEQNILCGIHGDNLLLFVKTQEGWQRKKISSRPGSGVVIGRQPQPTGSALETFVLDDPQVSRQHCAVELDVLEPKLGWGNLANRAFTVKDIRSTNGTSVVSPGRPINPMVLGQLDAAFAKMPQAVGPK